MAYRGGDLDLRTPRTWSASAPDAASPAAQVFEPRPRGSSALGPIWVDEVVLACVNHAYDVALAHRAAEVRLEHLLHALTRIDTAAEVLEMRGIKVSALRRESATVIASELPVGRGAGDAGPRHSAELEHVLRAASQIASRRNAPAAIDDVLHVVMDLEPGLPGLELLSRLDQRAALNGAYVRAPREAYYPRYVSRESEPQQPLSSSHQQMRDADRVLRVDYEEPGEAAIQPARLDVLEQMMRAVTADLGAERKSVAGLLGDIRREVAGLRAAPADVGPVVDRVATIERSVTAGFEQFSLALASIENEIRARIQEKPDLAPLASRLDLIEEAVLSRETEKAVRELSERIDRLETTLAGERTRAAESGAVLRGEIGQLAQSVDAHKSEIGNALAPLPERFAEIRSGGEARHAEVVDVLRALGDRMAAVERLVTDTLEKVIAGQAAARDDLTEVSDAIVKLNSNQHTLAASVDQARNDARENIAALREDVRAGTVSVTGTIEAIEPRLGFLEGRTQSIGSAVDGLSGTVENMHRVTIERYFRRNRFWYWLFGTDDWVAASWPSQSHRIAEELKAVKSVQQ
jgi:hypothetical protein